MQNLKGKVRGPVRQQRLKTLAMITWSPEFAASHQILKNMQAKNQLHKVVSLGN